MATSPASPPQAAGTVVSDGAKLQQILRDRHTTPRELLDVFNPARVRAHGIGTDGIGGDPASTGPFYVFFTTPDLNIDAAATKKMLGIGQPTAPDALARKLTGGGASGLIKLLTNLCESYNAQDVTLDTSPAAEAWDGAKLNVPKGTLTSRQDGTLQLEFQEWSGTPVTLMHKMWVDYIEAVTQGSVAPKNENPSYINNFVLDYAISIFAFHLMPDGETVEYGVKFTGCYPTAVPFSSWSGKLGASENIKVTIPYTYAFMEPMDSAIFYEFAAASTNDGVTMSNEVLKDSGRRVFKLRWTGNFPRTVRSATPGRAGQ